MGKIDRIKALRKERKAKQKKAVKAMAAVVPVRAVVVHSEPEPRIIPQQKDKGKYDEPEGALRMFQPVWNRAPDMIGRLHSEGKLTGRQLDAGRSWQALYAEYRKELDLKAYRSCLNLDGGGHDSGDGDPDVSRAFYAFTARLGRQHETTLRRECEKGPNGRPDDLETLRAALNAAGA